MGTLLLSIFLFLAGYSGNVVNADADILKVICGDIMYISGL